VPLAGYEAVDDAAGLEDVGVVAFAGIGEWG